MQAGGSHVNVPGCASLAHVGYLNAGLSSHASAIQVTLRSRSGSGSTQMYLQLVSLVPVNGLFRFWVRLLPRYFVFHIKVLD